MVRLPDDVDRGTGDRLESTADAERLGQEYGRQLAVDVITEQDSGPSAVPDGGLSPAARAWMDATPGVDVDDARRYEREQRIHREITRTGTLPPRGDRGDSGNHDRAEVVDRARHLLGRYYELEEQTE